MIHQLSIFLENTSGTLITVLQQLKKANVQMLSMTIADTAEYGILRIICTEPLRACDVLKQAGIAVALSDVFALELDNRPGSASDVVEAFSQAGISLSYIYTFHMRGKGIMIFRTDNASHAAQVIANNHFLTIAEEELAKFA
jgi:hypothetical protein